MISFDAARVPRPSCSPVGRGRLSGGRARLDHVLVEQVLKLGPAHLVAGRIGVGEVVGDVVDVELLGGHPASSAIKGSDHCFSFISLDLRWAVGSGSDARHFLNRLGIHVVAHADGFLNISNCRITPTRRMADCATGTFDPSIFPCSTSTAAGVTGWFFGSVLMKQVRPCFERERVDLKSTTCNWPMGSLS